MARPAFQPTKSDRELVISLSASGIPQADIARQIANPAAKEGKGIGEKTLRKYFREELASGLSAANTKVAQALYKQALGGNTTAMIFWLKCRARWTERQALEMSGPEGGPVPVRGVVVLPGIVKD